MIKGSDRQFIAEAIYDTARALSEYSHRMERIAGELVDSGDPECITDYLNMVSNVLRNLRLDMPTARYIRYVERNITLNNCVRPHGKPGKSLKP